MLRIATLLDMPRLLELARTMHSESAFSKMTFNEEKTEALLAYYVQDATGFVNVYERDGVIVGAFVGYCTPHFFSDDLIAGDLALFVELNRRGSLVGYRLLESFVCWATGKKATMIRAGISTGVNVDASTRLFEAVGFRQVGPIFDYPGSD